MSFSWTPVAHACNPNYSGAISQEDCGSKPALANSLQDPVLKYLTQKKGWWSDSRYRPQIQAPVPQNKEKTLKICRISIIHSKFCSLPKE
jgi:hypothetical protein